MRDAWFSALLQGARIRFAFHSRTCCLDSLGSFPSSSRHGHFLWPLLITPLSSTNILHHARAHVILYYTYTDVRPLHGLESSSQPIASHSRCSPRSLAMEPGLNEQVEGSIRVYGQWYVFFPPSHGFCSWYTCRYASLSAICCGMVSVVQTCRSSVVYQVRLGGWSV